MKIFEAVKTASEILKDSDTPQLDAEVILSHVLGKNRAYLYLNRSEILQEEALKAFMDMIGRRKSGEPVQYMVGKQEFMSLDFCVGEGVLIPRGDTEVLVEEVLKRIADFKGPVIVDVGCGSGAIGVSLAKYKKDSVVYALDIMEAPLKFTKSNAEKNGTEDRVHVIKSDMLKSLDTSLMGKIDVIVSNPPYIREDVIKTLMKSVRDFEPREALSGGEDGLYFYREITRQSHDFLRPGGLLAYEIGYDQREAVELILKKDGFHGISCFKDLGGNDRVITGWRE